MQPPRPPRSAGLEYFVLQASNESAVTAQAHVLLPAAVHVEDEGTFTNLDGITQRFRRAYPPRADAKAALGVGGATWPRSSASPGRQISAREVFRELGPAGRRAGQLRLGRGGAAGRRSPGASTRSPPARTGGRRGTVSSARRGSGESDDESPLGPHGGRRHPRSHLLRADASLALRGSAPGGLG